MQERSTSVEGFNRIATDFAATFVPTRSALLVTLSGELGAGKTTFVQAVAKALGVGETVASPTFVIEKIYGLAGQRFARLIHIDAYRLKNPDELVKLGWEELLADAGALILLEWPERVSELIPQNAIRVRIDIDGEGRIITVNGSEEKGGSR